MSHLGLGIGPIAALVLLRDDPGSAPFVLIAIGFGIVVAGVYVVSNVWKEPHYDVILAWDPEAMPADWETGRRRYFTINWIQLATTWTAFALFLVALSPSRPSRGSFQVNSEENSHWKGLRQGVCSVA